MKTPLLIVLAAALLGAGGALAMMNNACKSNHYTWCAQASDFQHHLKTGRTWGHRERAAFRGPAPRRETNEAVTDGAAL